MKHLTYFCALLAFVSVAMSGCKKDEPMPDPEDSVECAFAEIGINSIDVIMTASSAGEYAYLAATDIAGPTPTAETIFLIGVKGTLKSGENKVKVADLEGNTDYKVFVTTKSASGYGEVFASDKFTTKKYTDLVTMIDIDDYFAVKFHIEVPEGKTIAYAVGDRVAYEDMNEQFGFIDAERMMSGAIDVLTESKTIYFPGWESEDEASGEFISDPMLPGRTFVIVACEVESERNEMGYWMPLFDFEKWMNGSGGGGGFDPLLSPSSSTRQESGVTEEECWLTPYHTRVFSNARNPELLNVHVTVDVESHTTRSFIASLTPDESLMGYGYLFVSMNDWKKCLEWNGGNEAGALTYWSMNGMALYEDIELVGRTDFEPDTEYRLMIIGKGNYEGTSRSVDYYDFKVKQPTKPAPKVTVTAISNPEGEDSPWEVWFNVKSPSKDCKEVKYVCNSTAEVVKMINSGYTYDQLMTRNGVALDANAVGMINSDQGFNLKFDSWEDSYTRLVVLGYNEEETATEPDKNGNGYADAHSIELPAEPRVESELFAELAGEWTATAHLYTPVKQSTGETVWVVSEKPIVKKITIGAEPAYPSPCPPEAYKAYPKLTKDAVDELYAQFVVSSEKYARKTRGQNQLACQGLDFGQGMTGYYSPWALFLLKNYSAYTTDDMFYDYGPKWNLQIASDGRVTLPIDRSKIAPLMGYTRTNTPLYIFAANPVGVNTEITSFDVTVSVDKATIEILPAVSDSEKYYPTIASYANGAVQSYGMIHDLTLTKGVSSAKSVKSVTTPAQDKVQMLPVQGRSVMPSKVYRKTNLNMHGVTVFDYSKVIELHLTSLDDIRRK